MEYGVIARKKTNKLKETKGDQRDGKITIDLNKPKDVSFLRMVVNRLKDHFLIIKKYCYTQL